jgi:hypothetical protein
MFEHCGDGDSTVTSVFRSLQTADCGSPKRFAATGLTSAASQCQCQCQCSHSLVSASAGLTAHGRVSHPPGCPKKFRDVSESRTRGLGPRRRLPDPDIRRTRFRRTSDVWDGRCLLGSRQGIARYRKHARHTRHTRRVTDIRRPKSPKKLSSDFGRLGPGLLCWNDISRPATPRQEPREKSIRCTEH